MIYGISGKKGAGKDYLCDIIQECLIGIERRAFADGVRAGVATLTGIPAEELKTPETKALFLPEWGMTGGVMLQKYGTEVGRALHPNAWIIRAFAHWTRDGAPDAVFTDVRFRNENGAVLEHGGITVRVHRTDGYTTNDGRDPNHASEINLDDTPLLTVFNDGTAAFGARMRRVFSSADVVDALIEEGVVCRNGVPVEYSSQEACMFACASGAHAQVCRSWKEYLRALYSR